MTDKSISQLSAGGAVAGTDLIPNVQTVGVGPVKTTLAQVLTYIQANVSSTLTAGTTPTSGFTAGQILISDGSLLQAAGAAKATSFTASSLTSGRVPFASTAGLIIDNASLTFNSGTGALSATSFVGIGTLGVSTATSLAIGGATIGSNALAVTGITSISGTINANSAGNSIITSGDVQIAAAKAIYWSTRGLLSSAADGIIDVFYNDGTTRGIIKPGVISQLGSISSPATTTTGSRFIQAAATVTDTTSSGTVAAIYANAFAATTLAFSSATTVTNAYGTYYTNPVAGSGATFTKAWALGADSIQATTLRIGAFSDLSQSSNNLLISVNSTQAAYITNTTFRVNNGFPLGFSSSATGALTTAISEISSGVLGIGTGAAMSTAGTLIALNGMYGGGTSSAAFLTSSPVAISADVIAAGGTNPSIVLASAQTTNDVAVMVGYGNNVSGARIDLMKTRAVTTAATTIVQSGDTLGDLVFQGADGSNYRQGARIAAKVDGTPGTGADMPGRLEFYTTPDGSATPGLALTIDSAKLATFAGIIKVSGDTTGAGTTVGFGTNSPATTLTGPYTWLRFTSSDGSTVYCPAYK